MATERARRAGWVMGCAACAYKTVARGLNMAPQACRAPDGDGRVRPANYRVRTDALNDNRCRVKLSFAECNYLKMPDEEKVACPEADGGRP
jgi:hypothetical protein